MKTLVWFGFVLGALSAAGKVFVTKPEQTVTLECGLDSFKKSLEWRRENQLIFFLRSNFPKIKGTTDIVSRSYDRNTNLQVRKVKLEDAGTFTCAADGHTKTHTLAVVSVSTNPSGDLHVGSEVTLTCQVRGLNPEPAVQWKRPDGNQHTGPLKSVAPSDAGTWTCMFLYGAETYSVSIDIKVTEPPAPTTPPPGPFQSSPDLRKPTNPNCTANPASGASDLLGLKWWVWVAIGVGCLVVILLMVFVICLCKKIKTKKRRLQKMRNSCQLPKKYCQCNRPTAVAKPQGRRREKPSAPPLQPLLME